MPPSEQHMQRAGGGKGGSTEVADHKSRGKRARETSQGAVRAMEEFELHAAEMGMR